MIEDLERIAIVHREAITALQRRIASLELEIGWLKAEEQSHTRNLLEVLSKLDKARK